LIEGAVTLDGAILSINSDSSLTISSDFLQRGRGILEVDVSSSAQLQLQSLGQISGGGLVLYSSTGIAPNTKQFVSSQSIVGRGIDNIFNASLNSTSGFSYTNNTGALIAVVTSLPQISAISPASGPVGTVVTISGNNFVFGETYWNISVLFEGVAVPSVLATRLSLIATVPLGSGSGTTVTVLADGRMSNKLVWSYSPPVVQSVVPRYGPTLGTNLVTIEGNNFGDDPALTQVIFGSASLCTITQLTNAQIICAAPAGLGANVSVVVEVNHQQSPPTLYTYLAPVLQSVYPSTIVLEESYVGLITVTGQNLAYSENANSDVTVTIGDYTCENSTQTSLTTVACALPPQLLTTSGAGAYPIKIVVDGQTSSNLTFRVLSVHQSKNITNKWWPVPWWCLVAVGGAVALFFVFGLLVGCFGAKRGSGTKYEPVPTTIN